MECYKIQYFFELSQPWYLRNDMNVEKTLFWYISALTILSLIAWQITFIYGQYLGTGYPYNTFLYRQSVQFDDFTRFNTHFRLWISEGLVKGTPLNHAGEKYEAIDEYLFKTHPPITYSPTATYGYTFFHFLYPTEPVHLYLLSVFMMACIAALILGYRLRHSPVAKMFWITIVLTMLTSYPLMIELDRANIEGLLWIFLLLGTISFINNRFLLAGVLFAIATSMKLYPGIFLLLLIHKGRYKEFVISIFFLLWIFSFSAYELSGSISCTLNAISDGLLWTRDSIMLGKMNLGQDISLFAFIKQILFTIQPQMNIISVYYLYFLIISVGFTVGYVLKIYYLPFLNQLSIFTIAILLFPFISMDYKLLHLTIPWGVFIVFLAYDAKSTGFTTKQALHILISFAILFTPQTYLISSEIGGFGGQIKAMVLLYLLIFVLRNPMHSPTLFRE